VDLGLIALIFIAALLGPALSLLTRGAVPVVLGQLIAGVILGNTALRVINPEKSDLSLLYSLGFVTLMFTVGMRVPLHDRRLRTALNRGLLAVAVVVPLSLAAGLTAHLAVGGPTLLYAVVLGSSSAAVAMPIIEERSLEGPDVLLAMAWITLADIFATSAIPLVITPAHAGRAAVGVVIVAALVAIVYLVAHRLRGSALVRHVREEGHRRNWAIDLRFAVVVLFSLAFVAQEVGAGLLVAGFGTGLVVAAIGGPKRLSKEVLGLGQGFLVPLFFVLLGAKLNLRALSSDGALLLAGLLALFAIVVHVAAGLLVRAPAAVGLLATAQVGVPAAVIALGLSTHALDQGQASAIFCAALVSTGASAAGAQMLGARSASRGQSPRREIPRRS
jgi:Kef-type K+ transport system membrane component KefB